jgi:WD40 repeat protein
VEIWDTATGWRIAILGHGSSEVTALAVAPNSDWLATTTKDGTLRIWNIATADIGAVMRVDGSLQDCVWNPCGQSIAAAGGRGVYHFTVKL